MPVKLVKKVKKKHPIDRTIEGHLRDGKLVARYLRVVDPFRPC